MFILILKKIVVVIFGGTMLSIATLVILVKHKYNLCYLSENKDSSQCLRQAEELWS